LHISNDVQSHDGLHERRKASEVKLAFTELRLKVYSTPRAKLSMLSAIALFRSTIKAWKPDKSLDHFSNILADRDIVG